MGIQKINSYVCLPEGKPEKGDGNHQSIFIEKDVYIYNIYYIYHIYTIWGIWGCVMSRQARSHVYKSVQICGGTNGQDFDGCCLLHKRD